VIFKISPVTRFPGIFMKRHEYIAEKGGEFNDYQLTVRREPKKFFIQEWVYAIQGIW
jgi:hypothetical protein